MSATPVKAVNRSASGAQWGNRLAAEIGKELCQPYGTTVQYKGGVGVISWK